ncbi:hypothetical protein [Segatella sp.]|uniref:hypothetical protein n=1 Tax=Segatella sp. TaxID=2974253 RepID=UPI00307A4FBE
MAVVNVDYSEFETLKNRVKELEETVKEKDKTIASLKDGSRVIIRKEVQIEYERSTFDIICGSQTDHLYSRDDKPRRTVETSESYLGFEDVRLKIEDQMKDEINRSIKQRDDSRESYESSVQEYKEKKKKLAYKEKSLDDEYAKKQEALISEYKEKEKALEADYLDKCKAYKRQLEADYKSYKNQAGRLPLINKNAKEALSLLNANRFFKPKGVESILAQIIQKCEQ